MTKEEQSVVDSFEGEKSYETTTVTNPSYYLGGNQMLQIGMAN